MTKPTDPAFPQDMASHGSFPGLTKREYFAAIAMQGMLTKLADGITTKAIIWTAIECADFLITELEKK